MHVNNFGYSESVNVLTESLSHVSSPVTANVTKRLRASLGSSIAPQSFPKHPHLPYRVDVDG